MLQVEKLLKGFDYAGEFLDSNDLSDLLNNQDFEDFGELIKYLNSYETSHLITELADSKVDIYYYDLRQWSVDNYEYIEKAVDEFGADLKNFDFHRLIQQGQFYAYNNEFYQLISEFTSYLKSNYKF